MNKRLIIGSGLVIITVAVIALAYLLLPQFQPQKSIYDKMQEANIVYWSSHWDEDRSTSTDKVYQVNSFESFSTAYEEKTDPEYSLPSWQVHVYVDSALNVAWIEVKDSHTANIDHITCYFYTEPD